MPAVARCQIPGVIHLQVMAHALQINIGMVAVVNRIQARPLHQKARRKHVKEEPIVLGMGRLVIVLLLRQSRLLHQFLLQTLLNSSWYYLKVFVSFVILKQVIIFI